MDGQGGRVPATADSINQKKRRRTSPEKGNSRLFPGFRRFLSPRFIHFCGLLERLFLSRRHQLANWPRPGGNRTRGNQSAGPHPPTQRSPETTGPALSLCLSLPLGVTSLPFLPKFKRSSTSHIADADGPGGGGGGRRRERQGFSPPSLLFYSIRPRGCPH